ncbi:MAG: glutaredoxin family protein [Thermoleophilia bacterium]|nr:glutaredoxin family protein [Thermoleophilia bacterium]
MKAVVYSRADCHLCHEAIESLTGLATEFPGLEIDEIDIDDDDDLLRRYLERIPVVLIDGEIVSELVFDPEPVRARLRIP